MRSVRRSFGSCDSFITTNTTSNKVYHPSTTILIDADENANESTPLLLHDKWQQQQNNYYVIKKHASDTGCGSGGVGGCISGSSFRSEKICHYNTSCALRLLPIGLLLVCGFTIATYLLIIESHLPALRFSLDLISHDIWSNSNDIAIPLGGLLNHSNILNIIMTHTGGKHCENIESCVNVLKQMQAHNSDQFEIPYNFLIGGDKQTYEVRGWKYKSGFSLMPSHYTNTSLVIGFIGNYTNSSPSYVQLQSALSLLRESIKRKKLQSQYRIYGLRNLTTSIMDGEQLFKCITTWPKFNTLLHVL